MNEALYIQVKKYLRKELAESDLKAFESRLQEDSHFRKEVKLYGELYEGIQLKGDEELNEELMTLGKSLLKAERDIEKTKSIKRNLKIPIYVYAIAASILLLIIFVPFWPSENPLRSPEDLFSSNFSPAIIESGVRGEGDLYRLDSLKLSWEEAYKQKNYPSTIDYIIEMMADSSFTKRSEEAFYLGVSYLAIGDANKAQNAFSQVGKGSIYIDLVPWYISLSWLKQNNVEEARKSFQHIIDDPFYQNSKDQEIKNIYEKSQEILKSLKSHQNQ